MFVDAFSRHADDKPALLFLDSKTGEVSYRDLEKMIASFSSRLFAAGVRSNQIVAVDIVDDFLHAVALLSCARAAIATIAGLPGALGDELPVAAALIDRNMDATSAIPTLMVDQSWLASDVIEFEFQPPKPDDLCRIMLTSGSTGRPKGVALTYDMVDERMISYAHAFGADFPGCHRIMCSMKLSSSLGFGFLFHAVMRGDLFCSDSSDFDRITATIRDQQIDVLIAAPFILAELVAYCDSNSRAFTPVPLTMTAGSLVSPMLITQIKQKISRELVIFYGTTETGVIATTRASSDPGDVGRVVDGRRVEIVGLEASSTRPGEVGTIKVTSSSGILPYFDLADLATRSPRTSFSPGDLGFINPNGHVIIRGRSDDLINAGGTKVTPELLEQALAAAPGIKDCGVLRDRDLLGIDRVVAFLVLSPFWNESAFLAHCEANIVRDLLPSKFVVVQQIPRNQNQKIDRRALAALAV